MSHNDVDDVAVGSLPVERSEYVPVVSTSTSEI